MNGRQKEQWQQARYGNIADECTPIADLLDGASAPTVSALSFINEYQYVELVFLFLRNRLTFIIIIHQCILAVNPHHPSMHSGRESSSLQCGSVELVIVKPTISSKLIARAIFFFFLTFF